MPLPHEFYMQLALDEAWKYQGLTYPNPAVGALLLDSQGKILSIAAHQEAGKPHAEVLALKAAYFKLTQDQEISPIEDSTSLHEYLTNNHQNLFHECTLYVTLEPCNHYGKTPPCASLIKSLGIKEVIIGCRDSNKSAAGGIQTLQNGQTKTTVGVLEKACKDLIEPFMLWSGRRFVFLKWAQTLNGTIDGGTISSQESLDYVHKLRNKTDLLIIGGNSIRHDRPTLDARRINGKAPDVLILSKTKDFDPNIPLFNVPNRKVMISHSPYGILENYNFIMVESGGGLVELLKNEIHWNLTFIAPRSRPGKPFTGEFESTLLHQSEYGEDIALWSK